MVWVESAAARASRIGARVDANDPTHLTRMTRWSAATTKVVATEGTDLVEALNPPEPLHSPYHHCLKMRTMRTRYWHSAGQFVRLHPG